jgi:hypothetical protein
MSSLRLNAWCASRNIFVSVANKRFLDIEAHLERTKHTKNVQAESSSSKITNSLVQPNSKGNEVHAAECTLAFHCVNIITVTDLETAP